MLKLIKKYLLILLFILTIYNSLFAEEKSVIPKQESAIQQELILNFAYEPVDNFPFYLGEGDKINMKKPGTSIELLLFVAKKLNFKINFSRLPWKRCLMDLKTGTLDGVFHSSFDPMRLEFGLYPFKNQAVNQEQYMIENIYYFYVLKDSPLEWKDNKLINLKGSISVPLGYSIGAHIKKLGYQVEETINSRHSFLQLKLHRVAVTAVYNTIGDKLLEDYEFKDVVKRIEPPILNKKLYLMLSYSFVKKQPLLAEKIWQTIAEVRESEEFVKIKEKYQEEGVTASVS